MTDSTIIMSDLTDEQIEWAGESIDRLGGAEPHDWFVIYGREAERREAVADAFQGALRDRGIDTTALVVLPMQCGVQPLRPAEMKEVGWTRRGRSAESDSPSLRGSISPGPLTIHRFRVRDGDVLVCRAPGEQQRERLVQGCKDVAQAWDLNMLTVGLTPDQALGDLPPEEMEAYGWRRSGPETRSA
jgi:hypothetical protein